MPRYQRIDTEFTNGRFGDGCPVVGSGSYHRTWPRHDPDGDDTTRILQENDSLCVGDILQTVIVD